MASWLLIRKCKIETAELVWQVLHSDFHQPQGLFLPPFNNHIFLHHHFGYSQCLLLPLSHLDLSHNCCADKLKGTFNCKKWPITSPTQQAHVLDTSCQLKCPSSSQLKNFFPLPEHLLPSNLSFTAFTSSFNWLFTWSVLSLQIDQRFLHFPVQFAETNVFQKEFLPSEQNNHQEP